MSSFAVAPYEARSVNLALGMAAAALKHAETTQAITLVSSLIDEQGTILGARQRQPLGNSGSYWRRTTTGTSAFLRGKVLHHALALPQPNSLESDATTTTLLNRNLRGFLKAYTGLGMQAQYFGRETLSLRRQVFAVVGYEITDKKALLLEIFVGLDGAIAEPSGAVSSKSLHDICGLEQNPRELSKRVLNAFIKRYELTAQPIVLEPVPEAAALLSFPDHDVTTLDVPIGVIEAAIHDRQFHIFGDALTARYALEALEMRATSALGLGLSNLDAAILATFESAPLEGAKPEDFLKLLQETAKKHS